MMLTSCNDMANNELQLQHDNRNNIHFIWNMECSYANNQNLLNIRYHYPERDIFKNGSQTAENNIDYQSKGC